MSKSHPRVAFSLVARRELFELRRNIALARLLRIKCLSGGIDICNMIICPGSKRDNRLRKRASKRRQFIFHMRRHHRINRSFDKPVPLKPTEAQRQHSLRYSIDSPLDFRKPARAAGQKHNNEDAPFFPDAGQYLADLLTVGISKIMGLAGYIHDTEFS